MQKDFSVFYFLSDTLLVLLIQSCENQKKDPEYVGTWEFSEKITSNELVYNTTRTINLTRNSYEETYLIQRENSGIISAIVGTRGDLSQAHSTLTFSLNELGKCVRDESDACTDDIQWFGQGTEYFNDNIKYFEAEVAGEFQVNGNTLRLVRDLNNDGDQEDTGEDVTFTMI
jgi:hypothetical protein